MQHNKLKELLQTVKWKNPITVLIYLDKLYEIGSPRHTYLEVHRIWTCLMTTCFFTSIWNCCQLMNNCHIYDGAL